MKRILAMILVAVLLFTAALPGLAASGTQHGQTQEMQSAAILSEPGGVQEPCCKPSGTALFCSISKSGRCSGWETKPSVTVHKSWGSI